MRQYKCINVACKTVIYSDGDPKDVCSRCADIISGDSMRDESSCAADDIGSECVCAECINNMTAGYL